MMNYYREQLEKNYAKDFIRYVYFVGRLHDKPAQVAYEVAKKEKDFALQFHENETELDEFDFLVGGIENCL